MRRVWQAGLVLFSSAHGLLSTPQHVFCFGDSLTSLKRPSMRHRGRGGVTAADMLTSVDDERHGLRTLLLKNEPALAVILAGTNDVGHHVHAGAEPIFQALCGLHGVAHLLGVPTVAVGIPPSGYQAAVPAAAAVAADANGKLRAWCEARPDTCAYVDHPVSPFTRGGAYWSPDTLHLSPEGYRHVGRELADVVADRLRRIAAAAPELSPLKM